MTPYHLIRRLTSLLERSQWGVIIPEAREVVKEAREWLREQEGEMTEPENSTAAAMEALGNAINEYVAALRSATEPVFDVLAEAGQRHHAEKRAELEAKKAAFDAQMDKRWGK